MRCPHCGSELIVLATASCPLCDNRVPASAEVHLVRRTDEERFVYMAAEIAKYVKRSERLLAAAKTALEEIQASVFNGPQAAEVLNLAIHEAEAKDQEKETADE